MPPMVEACELSSRCSTSHSKKAASQGRWGTCTPTSTQCRSSVSSPRAGRLHPVIIKPFWVLS
eukprot:2148771-Prorocentrum_lima.AAC.1